MQGITVNAKDIIDASRVHQVLRGCAPTLIGLHPSDYNCIGPFGFLNTASATYVGGIRCVPCPDVEEGVIEILKPARP